MANGSWHYLVTVNNTPYNGMCCQVLRMLRFCKGWKLVESFTFEQLIYWASVFRCLLSGREMLESRLDIVEKTH